MVATPLDEMYILISTREGNTWYVLMQQSADPEENISCVNSYEVTGGVTQPFETINLTISQRRLAQMIPEDRFIDNIIPSKTMIRVNGYGSSTFIVSKVRVGGKGADRVCEIEAIAQSQQYLSSTTKSDYTEATLPLGIIEGILIGQEYGQESTPLTFGSEAVFKSYDPANNDWGGAVFFPRGTNVWRVLQICALRLGCKIWFEGENAYIVDFRPTSPVAGNIAPSPFGDISLHSEDSELSSAVLGSAEIKDDGIDSVINIQTIRHSGGEATYPIPIGTDPPTSDSIEFFGEREGRRLNIPEVDGDVALIIAQTLVSYREDMQRSIKFSMKEVGNMGWEAAFPPVSTLSEIRDELNDMIIDNESPSSNDEVRPQYLFLSEYTRHYPEGYTDYTWGKIANVDLPQALSSLMSN